MKISYLIIPGNEDSKHSGEICKAVVRVYTTKALHLAFALM